MVKIIKFILFIALAVFLGGYALYSYNVNNPADKNGKDIQFTVNKGDGIKKIAADLEEAGLIKSKFFFETYVWQERLQSRFQAGDYVLSPKLNIREIARVFVKGETLSKENTIKIIEGWNSSEIGQYLEKSGAARQDDFLRLAGLPKTDYRIAKAAEKPKDYSGNFEFLKDKPAYYGLEGYLFPDTYRIFKNASADDIIKKMLANFDKKLTPDMRAEIKRQNKTIFQIVTMASIVEKEVSKEEDMRRVAGIFWSRIKNGQALQSCASLAYILGVNKPQYSIEDTKINSPYNTYINRGLTPGPISNPGLNAIKAAIYPEYTPYNYFLSRPDTGETVFSKTFEEHVRNKAKYLK